MAKKTLVIVESPTKANLIGKFLGRGFDVAASLGHVRDLPKSKVGVDVEHGFEPTYTVSLRAKPIVTELKKLAKEADRVILAPDPDREGEAIAWHLSEVLGLGKKGMPEPERMVFHEITEGAVKEALASPRKIDERLVDAQQARRILDRLVGYGLSPFLWRKIRYGLSAGRVQSVAVRLVVEREREIAKFQSREYWSVEGVFEGAKAAVPARLTLSSGKAVGKFTLENEEMAKNAVTSAKDAAPYTVASVETKRVSRNPSPPFTTSTLQQEASRKLGFSAKQTMAVAQKLYEQGLITYMRTDSVHLAMSAVLQARDVLTELYGKEYALEKPRFFATKSKNAQEAHEAVRPTSFARTPDHFGGSADRNEKRLYDLIWKRGIASQTAAAEIDQTGADITGKDTTFRASGHVVVFPGFIKVYTEGSDDASDVDPDALPPLTQGQTLTLSEVTPSRHETEPPPRYTDATLIKALESHGIGRPSTYAPTLTTIQERGYVEKLEKKWHPTDVGELTTDLLVEHFPEIADPSFTAGIETELDEIAEGERDWREVLKTFYTPFKKNLDEKEAAVEKVIVITDTPCPHCGEMMLMKFGRTGKFLACPEPGSKVTLPTPEEAAEIKALEDKTEGEHCALCGKLMKIRKGRFGYFLGCVDYPTCKGVSKIWNRTGYKCPHCRNENREPQGDIVERKGRGRAKPFYGCNRFPDCTFLMPELPTSEEMVMDVYSKWLLKPPVDPSKKKPWGKKTTKKVAKKKTTKKTAKKTTKKAVKEEVGLADN